MSALKGRDIERFLKSPDITKGYCLIYGPDAGLVSENALRLVHHFAGNPPDAEALVSLQMSEIDADPQKLAIEARTPSLFGDGRVIRVRNASNKLAATLKELLGEEPDAIIVVEGGNLTPGDALRKLAEQRPDARAVPCYADSSQSIDSLIRQTFADHGIRTDSDVVPLLRDMLGNDRQVTRGELEKLVLFAADSKHLSQDDVQALCGDNAALAIDAVIDAIGTGHARKFDDAMTRALSAGTDMQRLLSVSLQHFMRLRTMKADMESGQGAEEVLRKAVPRIHFTRKSAMEQQLRLWNDDGLAAACQRLQLAVGESRKQPALGAAAARQAMLAVCMAAARR